MGRGMSNRRSATFASCGSVLCSTLLITFWLGMSTVGHAQTQIGASALPEQEKLERDFTDPLTTLPHR